MGISVNTSSQQITASVGETKIDVSVGGGVGPTGSPGPAGATDYTQLTNVPSSFNPTTHASRHGQAGSDPITIVAAQVSDFTSAVVAAAPPTTDASLLTSGTLSASRLPSSGVVSGTYTSVTVDATGRVTAGGSHSVSWNDISSKPSTFTPSTHTHATSDVTGLDAALSNIDSALDGKAAASHGHTGADLTLTPSGDDPFTLTDPYAADFLLFVGYGSSSSDASLRAINKANCRLLIDAAASAHNHTASAITSGVLATARLASSGTASATTFLRGDQTWATVTSGSTSASDLTSGTLADARLSANARQAIDNLIHPFLLAGM